MENRNLSIEDMSVVVVEPSSTQWKIISGHLKNLGVEKIEWFKDAQHCLKDIKLFKPDLVISAMHLADMSGTELVQIMRRVPDLEDIPFMVISSEISDYYLEPVRQAGVVAILPKPFKLSELKSALFSALDFLAPDNSELADINLDELAVLVVDDSLTARKHITRVLTNLGMENITQATNGKEAIELLGNNFFDLVVTDYNMPEMDGKELTSYIRTQSKQASVPILMVTSEASQSHLAGVKQLGVSAMCDKPFEPGMVKSLIKNILIAEE